MTEGRKVMILKWERSPADGKFVKVDDKQGVFLSWGINYQEVDGGPGMFTAGVIELEDGHLEMHFPEMFRFLK